MSYFLVKQLPVLPPETYLEEGSVRFEIRSNSSYRACLELTYTAHDLKGFASRPWAIKDLPFPGMIDRRHRLQCELDAVFSHMYQLERTDVEWILDTPPPGSSFPALKRNEINEFGEFRTQRYVLHAYDQLARGELPDLKNV